VAPPAAWGISLYYLGLGGVWLLWHRAPRTRPLSIGVAAMAAIWMLAEPWTLWTARGDGRLYATFIDVGQGDSIAVRFPRGTTMLVDAGGLTFGSGFDVGDRVVAPVLREAGIRRLDYLVLTHGDPDHVGGAASVLREFRPRSVWEGIPVPRFEPLAALRATAQMEGLHWASVSAGNRVVIDDVEVTTRSPGVPDWERRKVRNDDSIVLDLRWRDVSILLTGDIGKGIERELITSVPESRLRVLKVPHHGSLTSSSAEFVHALHPDVAVFSVGRNNHFGHPVPEVLQRYEEAGSAIFRTDLDGAISLETDGYSLNVHGFTGREWQTGFHEDTKETNKNTKP
jgi:competence protein ComEC